MSADQPLGLFAAYGVEIEYMIVDRQTLGVLPVSDELLRGAGAEYVAEIECGGLNWSNELVLHVLELKTAGPAPDLSSLAPLFQSHVGEVNKRLADLGGQLMPTAMHPWMDPAQESRVWPHGYSEVYAAFNRIFDCRGHGWSNLQSVHINLPFSGDEQFARLHAAIRLLLPIMPALAASSPVVEGCATGLLDTRLDVYRTNARRIPSVTGSVVPEAISSAAEYQSQILAPMYADIAPFDPAGELQFEWLNARGAIARFDRNAIEIRVLDVQECPAADLAIVVAIVSVLRQVVGERWTPLAAQHAPTTESLSKILLDVIRDGERAMIDDAVFLAQFGRTDGRSCTAGELWLSLAENSELLAEGPAAPPLQTILREGPLARRILQRLNGNTTREALVAVYRELCECLSSGTMFHA